MLLPGERGQNNKRISSRAILQRHLVTFVFGLVGVCSIPTTNSATHEWYYAIREFYIAIFRSRISPMLPTNSR